MRYSKFFLPTLKEVPSEAEVISHKLMLRAGMIRKLSSGLYSYLPTALASIRKVEAIIREEMTRAGAQEVLLPMVQPAELWKESGRWEHYGKELVRFKDRHDRDFCLGPTHEEVITDLVRKEVRSYRDMPLNLFQIQTKFRDEIRPRFGLMRSREFIMKDGYSFDVDDEALGRTYLLMHDAYTRIFERCGLDFRAVEADTGTIGGHESHEFMVMADSGEDVIACCRSCKYASNVELANTRARSTQDRSDEAFQDLKKVHTPSKRSIEEVTGFLNVSPESLLKTLVLISEKGPVVALLRGDHELNDIKIKRYLDIEVLRMAEEDEIMRISGAPSGFSGPIGIKEARIVADEATVTLKNFVTGANEADAHFVGVNWERDVPRPEYADIRMVCENDPCPSCGNALELRKGIEVGHIFKLGTKYSESLGATYLDEKGRQMPIVMGCYGIGVGRTVAASIEQNHDEYGIIFPSHIAPFEVVICLLDPFANDLVKISERLYSDLKKQGMDVLLDDRDTRPGVKFKDADLIGIPIRITLGKLFKKEALLEVKKRSTGEILKISEEEFLQKAREILTE